MEFERFAIAIVSFLIGSVPFGYLVSKYKGVDIRKYGSGNIGATNVYRVFGKKYGALTLLLDLSKGLICVLAAKILIKNDTLSSYIAAIFAVLGHDFSVFLKFKGGKGVAATYGSTLPLFFPASFAGMLIWLVILITTKYSSAAALLSFSISTAACFLLNKNGDTKYVFLFLLIIMFIKHRENIRRFYFGNERRLNI